MDNFDLKKYLNNNPLLNEITINPGSGRLFPKQYINDLNLFTDGYLESSSPEGILEPDGENYDLERMGDDPDDPQYIAFQNIINNLKPGIYLIKAWANFSPAPGAPSNSYDTKITITTDGVIEIRTAPLSDDGENAGWFDNKSEYYPDLKHFDEDGSSLTR
jgi:hypothetical protein